MDKSGASHVIRDDHYIELSHLNLVFFNLLYLQYSKGTTKGRLSAAIFSTL